MNYTLVRCFCFVCFLSLILKRCHNEYATIDVLNLDQICFYSSLNVLECEGKVPLLKMNRNL